MKQNLRRNKVIKQNKKQSLVRNENFWRVYMSLGKILPFILSIVFMRSVLIRSRFLIYNYSNSLPAYHNAMNNDSK